MFYAEKCCELAMNCWFNLNLFTFASAQETNVSILDLKIKRSKVNERDLNKRPTFIALILKQW